MKLMKDIWTKHQKSIIKYGGMLGVFLIVIMIAVIPLRNTPVGNDNALAVDLGFAQIQWYAIFILTGISLGAFLAYHEFKKLGIDTELLYDALLWAVPLAIIGTRIYYVIFDPTPNYETFWDVINITRGGLAIHGAVIVTIIFLIIWTRIKKLSFWLISDVVAPGFLIGQIVGRWGNFMNREAYGPVIQSEFLLNILPNFITKQMTTTAGVQHPTFLYEGIWNFIGLLFILIARRHRWFKSGDMIAFYLIWYGLGRGAIIEPLRSQGAQGDALEFLGIYINVYLSLTLFMLGGVAIFVLKRIFVKELPYYYDMLIKEENVG